MKYQEVKTSLFKIKLKELRKMRRDNRELLKCLKFHKERNKKVLDKVLFEEEIMIIEVVMRKEEEQWMKY